MTTPAIPARKRGRHRAGNPAPSGPLTDTALLAAVREGDATAYGYLYHRHREAARRLARALIPDPSDAEDLVSEAFARVLAALRAGGGPEVAFRAYLLAAVRHAAYDRHRRERRLELTDEPERRYSAARRLIERPEDPAVARMERSYAARAFAKLPERWRMVLWHTEVEGERPSAVAPLLGISPNAVAVLASRARERLRQIYLQEHLRSSGRPACRWAAEQLGAYVRRGLPRRSRRKVASHLSGCGDCRALWQELTEVNSGLHRVLAPLVLGGAALPYLSVTTSATGGLFAAVAAAVAMWPRARRIGPAPDLSQAGSVARRVAGWLAASIRPAPPRLAASVGRAGARSHRRYRTLVQRYGAGNVATGAGVATATAIGVALFTVAALMSPFDAPPTGADAPPTGAEAPRPVAPGAVPHPSPAPPAPADPPAPTPATGPERPQSAIPPAPAAAAPVPSPPRPPAPPGPGRSPSPSPPPWAQSPAPSPTDPPQPFPGDSPTRVPGGGLIEVTADDRATSLVAGETGTLALTVVLPAPAPNQPAPAPSRQEATPAPRGGTDAPVVLIVSWPEGIRLAGTAGGDSWQCAPRKIGAACQRPAWPAGQARTVQLPVAVPATVAGIIPLAVTLRAGDRYHRQELAVPAAPPGTPGTPGTPGPALDPAR